MKSKIKNNINKIVLDINRYINDLDSASDKDAHIYLDVILSQASYLTDNIKILKEIVNGPSSQEKTHINNTANICLPENTSNNDTNNASNTSYTPTKIVELRPQSSNIVSATRKALSYIDNSMDSPESRQLTTKKTALKNTISLNDKFTFVRYLFKNNITIYSEHIHNIDKLTTKDEVLTYINQYLSKLYNWDENPDKKELFIKIIEKHFE